MSKQDNIVPYGEPLPPGLDTFLRVTNPWWTGQPMLKQPPPYRRWLFEPALQRLKNGMAPMTVLRGTRQVGKTTLVEQIIEHLLYEEGVAPNRIFRVQLDNAPLNLIEPVQVPILALSRWFEVNILGGSFGEWARKGEPAYLFFDEMQRIPDWAMQIKTLVDHFPVRGLLTGSSAFSIEQGRDSLAGRILTLEMNTLLLREITALRGWGEVPPLLWGRSVGPLKEQKFWQELRRHGKRHQTLRDKAFAAFSERGGYPVAQILFAQPWDEMADYLNETIIRRVIEHDLGAKKQDKALLEQVFRLACRYAGQSAGKSVLIGELQAALSPNINWPNIVDQLRLLNNTLLIRLVQPLELRLKRQKAHTPKICLSDHSLRASWLQEEVPLTPTGLQQAPHLGHLAGYLAENIAGYFLSTLHALNLSWFPARKGDPEVDFIITVGQYRIPMEVKYRLKINESRDTANLRTFLDKPVYNAPFGILLTLTDDVTIKDPRIVALPLSSLLLMR